MSKPETLVGKQVDQFTLEAFIARGAMGMVFRAFDSVLSRMVALKLIPKISEESSDEAGNVRHEEARKRLIQEAKAAGKLTQPNIVTIHAYGETEEFQYICMEYISGKTLAQVLKERGKIPVEEAIPIFEQILLALEAADREGIVHRDIKPANIMITRNNQVKVMDFGIAKLPSLSMTVTGMVLGTPYYMSPEQISGKKVDIRSDIFSLGAVIYEVLTGEKPFEGESTATLTYKIVQVDPIPPNIVNKLVPDPLAAIISKALAKDPANRYQNPTEMIGRLKSLSETPRTGEATVISHTPSDDSTIVADQLEALATQQEPVAPVRHETAAGTSPPASRSIVPVPPLFDDEAGPEQPPPAKPAKAKLPLKVSAKDEGSGPAQIKTGRKSNLPLFLLVLVLIAGGVVFGLRFLKGGGGTTPDTSQPPPGPPATILETTTLPPPPPPPPAETTLETTQPFNQPSPDNQPEPSVEALRIEAGKLFTSNPERAQELLERALSLDPNDYDSSLTLARLLSYRRDYSAAIRQYQHALRLDNRAADVHYELGSLFMGQGNYDSAIQSYQLSLILMPKNRDEVLAGIGFCHLKKGEPAQARSLFQQSLDLNPNNPTAKAFIASLPVPATQPPPPPSTQAPVAKVPATTQPPVVKTPHTTQPPPPPMPKKTRIEENLPGRWSFTIAIQGGQVVTGQVDIEDKGDKLKMVATATYWMKGQDGYSHQFYEKNFFFGTLRGQNLTARCDKGEFTMDGRSISPPALPLRLNLVVAPEGRFMQGYVSNSQGVTTQLYLNKR